MIQEFLAGTGKMGNVMPTDQPGKRFLPLNRQPLELLEETAIDQGCRFHATSRDCCGRDASDDFAEDGFRSLAIGMSVEIQDNPVTQDIGRNFPDIVDA